ncbi:MAG: M1 family metallopeptidase [Candidatus Marinimicrobia bacterium]|nr:M1 family metallopeptidase [Candidatus Neomarinimicrobiota bacterium]
MNQLQNKFIRIIFIMALFTSVLLGQYWQQYVKYNMDVSLDTEAKILSATSRLLYVNNSPDSLDHLFMHLYHNAYNEGTIAAAVWADYGDTFDKEKGWTGIKINQVSTDSIDLKYLIRDDTILDISLNQTLAPGDTLSFELDWISLIHPHIDRSGWEDKQYDFAQWYPKFVVYDENGWHDDPFGDWGEFYGEFGDFTVHLDLPAEQIVGATGVVIEGDPGWVDVTVDTSQTWTKWVNAYKVTRSEALEKLDSNARREVTFSATNVHDFAWLCSPDFVYEHASWNGIDIHALFTTKVGEDWTRDVVEDGVSAIRWLSNKFGAYPWPQMTISKALLGGGMEYPMLIMDASESESLIVHEIGHNWFYGLFASDELDDAWLDEGSTTFQTRWYQEHFYPDNGYAISRKHITAFEDEHLPRQMYLESALKSTIRYMQSPRNEPIATHSFDFTNYGSYRTNVYTKASLMLHSLKEYLGEDRFLAGMRLYYDLWALKHVNEGRFIKAMEDATGEELDWFFDQWLHTIKYVDYGLNSWNTETVAPDHFKTSINVENIGGMFVPISATIFGANSETASASLKEFRYRDTGIISVESDFKPERVYLDADNVFLDVDRRDNDSQRKWSYRYNFKDWDEYPDDKNLYLWKPQMGFNDTDGLGIGLRIDRVYRNAGDFTALELDYNLATGNPDMAISFEQEQIGLPFVATWSGSVGTWHSMSFADLNYELNWAKVFWENPVHYLTLSADYTDGEYAGSDLAGQSSFMRFGLKYELQHDLSLGDFGLSAQYQISPAGLGRYGQNFNQFSFMGNWARGYRFIKINNRCNFEASDASTPDMVKSQLASRDLRSIYLDRMAATLHQTSGIDLFGPRYYLAGGGRLRGYTDSLDAPVNYLWSNNVDLSFNSGPFGPDRLDFETFFDFGQSSNSGKNWEWLADVGVGIYYRPTWKRNSWLTTIIRPVRLKIALPVMRYENGSWVSTLSNNSWVFSISN